MLVPLVWLLLTVTAGLEKIFTRTPESDSGPLRLPRTKRPRSATKGAQRWAVADSAALSRQWAVPQ
jgi:hypothetical protein